MTTQPGYDGDRPDGDPVSPTEHQTEPHPEQSTEHNTEHSTEHSTEHQADFQPWDPAYSQPYDSAYGGYPPPSEALPPQGAFQGAQWQQSPEGALPPEYPQGAQYPQYPQYPLSAQYPQGAQFPQGPEFPQGPRAPRRRRRAAIAIGAAGLATIVAVAVASGTTQSVNGTAIASSDGSSSSTGSTGGSTTVPGTGSNTVPGTVPGNGNGNGNGNFPFPNSGNSGSSNSSSAKASAAQQVGVVDILTVQKYASAEAAGTGMVLSSNGRILTNNHVIDGATSIKVTVVSTGKSYTATVVGTAPTKDIAVLQLQNASGLKTANLGDSSTISVGDAVTGVGNAGGAGGTPSAASGKVTEIGRTITASDEDGASAETLHGVIVTDAPIQSGDSGGPLYNAKNEVIGIDTAASTNGQSIGFAIPINTALSVAAQIEKGVETSSIHIGYPGFLGISVSASQVSGALVSGVLNGGPAADAGLTAGDVITRVGSTTISNSTQLQQAVSSHDPGSKVSVTYTDPSTGTHTVTVTLETGPAD